MPPDMRNPACFKGGAAVNIKSLIGEVDTYSVTTQSDENLAASCFDAVGPLIPISVPANAVMARLTSKPEVMP